MKSFIKLFLFVVLLSGMNDLQANNRTPTTKVEHAGAKNIAVYIEFPVTATVQLSIRDVNNVLVFSESFRDIKIFAKKIDLALLPKGDYVLEVEGPQKIYEYGLKLSDDQLLIEGGKPKVIFKPVFAHSPGFMDITMLTLDGRKITVKIISSDQEILLRKVFENTKSLEKRFDISNLPSGVYSFVVSDGERTYTKSLMIR